METASRWIKLVFSFFATLAAAYAAGFYLIGIAQTQHAAGAGQLSFKECMDVAQVAITGLGLASIVLLWKQLSDTSRWNKLLSYHQFFMSFPNEDITNELRNTLREHKQDHILRDKEATLPADVAKKLYEGNEPDGSKMAMDRYLDVFETFCAAIHCGLIRDDYAYKLEAGRVIKNFKRFEKYIELAQEVNKRAFVQFKHCARRWGDRRKKEDDRASRGDLVGQMAP